MKGTGIWGVNIPVGWGFAIINFVWWIGIGHAGTLISAILLLFRQKWRMSISRFAEAMTIFAVHVRGGLSRASTRAVPGWRRTGSSRIPNTMGLWPQLPQPADLGRLRGIDVRDGLDALLVRRPDPGPGDDARPRAEHIWVKRHLRLRSRSGWRGSAMHWQRYETASLLLAGLATPLVLSVHTVVSFDFAVSVVPGWHATIFPPYFVAGAIYSGFAMVLTLAIPIRAVLRDGRLHHDAPHPEHGEDHAGDGPDRGVRLRGRSVHGLVQRQPVRDVHDLEPHVRDRTGTCTGA